MTFGPYCNITPDDFCRKLININTSRNMFHIFKKWTLCMTLEKYFFAVYHSFVNKSIVNENIINGLEVNHARAVLFPSTSPQEEV